MADIDEMAPTTLQFVVEALRTHVAVDLTTEAGRRALSTDQAVNAAGHRAVHNGDGTALTIAQIVTASGLTTAQVEKLAGRLKV